MKLANNVRRVSGPDGAIVMHLGRGTMFRVSSTGARILDLLEQGQVPDQIATQISTECGVPLNLVREDIDEFILRLRTLALIDSIAGNI